MFRFTSIGFGVARLMSGILQAGRVRRRRLESRGRSEAFLLTPSPLPEVEGEQGGVI